ncbi:SAM-dependent methyltransferase [Betaproteobacteria bacterium]|nr:SAM-dependent methyltransferase [Betaproteobacteria bacterium]
MVLQNLKNFIKKKGGWIPFDSFMFECLYGNDDSYYMRKNTSLSGLPFGPSGDYVTSASLGHWMARAYADIYAGIISKTSNIDKEVFAIREYGPGTGELAAKILIELFDQGILPKKYEMLEISQSFIEFQKNKIADILKRHDESLYLKANNILEWKLVQVDREEFAISTDIDPINGLVIASEIIDSFPVKVALWQPTDEILELGIRINHEGDLEFQNQLADDKLIEKVLYRKNQALENGYLWTTPRMLDICFHTERWLKILMGKLSYGELIISDYGLERYELDSDNRIESNVTAFFKHTQTSKLNECLKNVGSQDLTYLVDFSQLSEFFLDQNDCYFHLKSQAAWLIDSGVLDHFSRNQDFLTKGHEMIKEVGNLQKLISDNEMGQSFLFCHVFKNNSRA